MRDFKAFRLLLAILALATFTSCAERFPPEGSSSDGSSWTSTPGSLTAGSWHSPANAPDTAHAGGWGGIAYAPNGDLYSFYQKGVYPNQTLYGNIRRSTGSTWSFNGSEKSLGFRNSTADVYFKDGVAHVVSETLGSVYIITCSNCENDSSISWNTAFYTGANDGNPDGVYARNHGFLTTDGTNLNLFFSYLYYSAVTGGKLWGVQAVKQTAGAWPADGTSGTAIDTTHVSHIRNPHGVTGAFQNGSTVLVFSSQALRSTDSGSNFTQVMNSGSDADDLTGVSGACQNTTDTSSIVALNFYGSAGNYNLAVWGTRDYGANFTKLKTFTGLGTIYRGRVLAIQNLIMVLYSSGTSENTISETHSYDSGSTWTTPTTLVDATTDLGSNPTYSIGEFSMTSNSAGSIALQYSIMDGETNRGVYLKEFY